MNIPLILENAKVLQADIQGKIDIVINETDNASDILSRIPDREADYFRGFKKPHPEEPNPTLAKARYAINFKHYLTELLQGLEDDPEQWILSFEKNQETIGNIIKENGKIAPIFWKKVDLPKMKALVENITALEEALESAQRAGTQTALEKALEPILAIIKDMKIRSDIHLTTKQHEEEIALFTNLYNQLAPLVQQYRDPNAAGQPEQEVSKIKKYMRDELPSQLKEYGDDELPGKLKNFFKKSEKVPLLRPAPMLAFVERALQYLKQENTMQSRFTKTREKIVAKIQLHFNDTKKDFDKEIKRLRRSIKSVIMIVTEFEKIAHDTIEATMNKDEVIAHLLENYFQCLELISKISNECTGEGKSEVVLAAITQYEILIKEQNKLIHQGEKIDSVIGTWTTIAVKKLEKVRLVS
jgi:hypothetical protein